MSHEINEQRVIGPPGCGKTAWISQRIAELQEQGKSTLVTSLTRAAAEEIAARAGNQPGNAAGTLHSQCFHRLNRPPLALGKGAVEGWNEAHPAYPLTPLRDGQAPKDDEDAEAEGNRAGDALMGRLQTLRGRMTPEEEYPQEMRGFAQAWRAWKDANGLSDFTDLIQRCLDETDEAPGAPDLLFVDEAQDLDRLEAALLRHWARRAEALVLVGDPDQCLYQWRGADPSLFRQPEISPEDRTVLSRSYRVPEEVHQRAMEWINQVPDREEVLYLPREHQGEMRRGKGLNWRSPARLLADAERYLERDMEVMMMASCAYMLDPLKTELRAAGLPFHNPLRPANTGWNPLARRENRTGAAERLAAFLKLNQGQMWNAEDLRSWTGSLLLKGVSNLKRKELEELANDEEDEEWGPYLSWDIVLNALTEEAVNAGFTGDLAWYRDRLSQARREGAHYPLKVAENRGAEGLTARPQIMLGTIHSFKGGEADVVYLLPDLSRRGWEDWGGGAERRAGVYRMFYVGMTRARETLVICDPETHRASPGELWRDDGWAVGQRPATGI